MSPVHRPVHGTVRGTRLAMGSPAPVVPDMPYAWRGKPGWDPMKLGPMLTSEQERKAAVEAVLSGKPTNDSRAVTTPDGSGLNAALEAPRAAVLDAALPRGGVQGISPRGVARGEHAGPVPPGPALTSPLEPAPPGFRGAREGELPAPLRTADGSSLPDTDPAGSTRSTASLPAAGRS
jgi:hypothetical protein